MLYSRYWTDETFFHNPLFIEVSLGSAFTLSTFISSHTHISVTNLTIRTELHISQRRTLSVKSPFQSTRKRQKRSGVRLLFLAINSFFKQVQLHRLLFKNLFSKGEACQPLTALFRTLRMTLPFHSWPTSQKLAVCTRLLLYFDKHQIQRGNR